MLYFNLFLAGFLMLLTPGPVFVANIALISQEGRLKGLQLMSGAIIGDILWLFLTCLFIIETNRLPETLFNIFAVICGIYILYLAYRIYQGGKHEHKARIFKRPFIDGLMLGIFNPKSYPVFVALFSALVLDFISQMTWVDFPAIFFFSLLGFIAAYALVLITAGFKAVKDFYSKNFKHFSYLFAAIFVYFGVTLIIGIF